MVILLAQLKFFENDQVIYLTCNQDCNTQIIKNALIDFMAQVSVIEENAKNQEAEHLELQRQMQIEETPLENEGA